MAESTTDHSILKKIEGLVHEEQHLYGKGELADHDQVRLEAIKIELDQCWDLLGQREARREFGQDPNDAKVVRPRSSRGTSSNRWIAAAFAALWRTRHEHSALQ